jgi:RNA polymerase sigma factor (TIGR02999 family)
MSGGDVAALNELTPMVYAELHRIAQRQFSGERRHNNTLQPTAIVNEAYLHLVKASVDWSDRTHFFALAARMMRRIIINHVNARRAEKRGGGAMQVTFEEPLVASKETGEDVLELDQAMRALQEVDAVQAEVLELFYFGGLTYEQIADLQNTSAATIKRKLRFAKAWINRYLSEPPRK